MKCPRCGLNVTDQVPRCRGCGFSLSDLDGRLRQAPERAGFVNDFAGLLAVEEAEQLEARLRRFQQSSGGEIVVATVTRAKPLKPAEYVFWLFNRWQIGGEAHAGILILLAQEERRVECEVGYSWEPIITDVESGAVLDEHVVPLLKEGRIAAALAAGAAALAEIITRGSAGRPGAGEGDS